MDHDSFLYETTNNQMSETHPGWTYPFRASGFSHAVYYAVTAYGNAELAAEEDEHDYWAPRRT